MRRESTRPSEARPVVGKRFTDKLALKTTRHVAWPSEARPITGKWLRDELAIKVTRPVTWPSYANQGATRSTQRTMVKPGPGTPQKASASPAGPPKAIRTAEGKFCQSGPRPSEARPITGTRLTDELALNATRSVTLPSEARPITGKWLPDELTLPLTRRVAYATEARPVTGKWLTHKLAAHVTRSVVPKGSAKQGCRTGVRAGDRAPPQRPTRDKPTCMHNPGTRVSFVNARPCGLETPPAPRSDLVVAALSTEDETAADRGAGAQPRRGPQQQVAAHGPHQQASNRALCCHNGDRRPAWRP
jgi:hypothetical protein